MVFHGGLESDGVFHWFWKGPKHHYGQMQPKPWPSIHCVLNIAEDTRCCLSVLTSSVLTDDLKQKCISIRPVATNFQSSSCVMWHISAFLTFLKNGFVTAIFPLRLFLMRLQWAVDESTEGPDFSLSFSYFLRKWLSDTETILSLEFFIDPGKVMGTQIICFFHRLLVTKC